jgi:hypothetical protein
MYILDSDAARTLCQYGLVEELAAALGVSLSDFAVLPQLKYQLKIGSTKAIEVLGSQQAVELADKLIEAALEVSVSTNSANLILLSDRPDIDAGELILFVALADNEKASMVTGDKRALAALSSITAVRLLTLWPRLICLEEAIALLIAHSGLSLVSGKIRARPDVNVALTLAFGKSAPQSLGGVLEGLSSYVADVIVRTNTKYQIKNFPNHGICLT